MTKGKLLLLLISLVSFSFISFAAAQDKANNVLAIVGDKTLTVDDFTSAIRAHPLFLAYYQGKAGKERLLRDLMDIILFSQEARVKGLDKRPDVQQRISSTVNNILAEEYMGLIRSSINHPSENDLIVYYERNKGRFRERERIRIRHWVFKSEEEAKAAIPLIKTGKYDDQDTMEPCTDCKGNREGESGWIKKGSLSPDLENLAFSLNDGEISDILKANSGYHVVQLLKREAPRQKMFFEVKEMIREEFLRKEKARLTEKERKELENKYLVKVFPEKLSDIQVFSLKPKMTDELFLEIMRQKPPLKLGQ